MTGVPNLGPGQMDRLSDSVNIYRAGQIPEVSATGDAFLAWHKEIINWHTARPLPNGQRPSNDRIERTNNLLHSLHRKAPGFTD